jgi:hypothetical protein
LIASIISSANCDGTRVGPIVEKTAELLSALRELTDVPKDIVKGAVKGDIPSFQQLLGNAKADLEANRVGREGAKENPNVPCPTVCHPLRPEGSQEHQ